MTSPLQTGGSYCPKTVETVENVLFDSICGDDALLCYGALQEEHRRWWVSTRLRWDWAALMSAQEFEREGARVAMQKLTCA